MEDESVVMAMSENGFIEVMNEALSLLDVSNNEERVTVCPEWLHKERRKVNEDNFCPICGTDIRQADCP